MSEYKIGDKVVFIDYKDDHVFEVYEYRAQHGHFNNLPWVAKLLSISDMHEARADFRHQIRHADDKEIEARCRL